MSSFFDIISFRALPTTFSFPRTTLSLGSDDRWKLVDRRLQEKRRVKKARNILWKEEKYMKEEEIVSKRRGRAIQMVQNMTLYAKEDEVELHGWEWFG